MSILWRICKQWRLDLPSLRSGSKLPWWRMPFLRQGYRQLRFPMPPLRSGCIRILVWWWIMDKKDIIIIILSLIIIAFLAVNFIDFTEENQILYHTVNITDSFSLDVPVSDNVTKTQVSPHMHVVNDSKNNIEITSFNMGNESALDLIEDGSQYIYKQEAYKIGAEQINISNHTVWYNRNDGNYIAFFSNDTTNDNVIIVTKDNLTMERLIGTVRYHWFFYFFTIHYFFIFLYFHSA